jgi:deoxycytidylate deaminase
MAHLQTSASGPELVIGFVAPTGNDFDLVADAIAAHLHGYNYSSDPIRLSGFLAEIAGVSQKLPVDECTRKLQDAGDELRRVTHHGDALAYVAMREIRAKRIEHHRQEGRTEEEDDLAKIPLRRHAYLLWSFKHPDEADTLRKVYGSRFVLISVYRRRTQRFSTFVADIARSRHQTGKEKDYYGVATAIIERDEIEPDNELGQNVRDTYPRADFFIEATDRQTLTTTVARSIDIVFGALFETPTPDEYAMAIAHTASLRSAEPGRQVGAAIVNGHGEVVAVGTNDVPRAGGGQYWATDRYDKRAFQLGADANEQMKSEIARHVFDALKEAQFIRPDKEDATGEEVYAALSSTRVRDLIEFGRAVHAEQAAIAAAARAGVHVQGGTLYVTTFPCHLCARLIVVAGIDRVVYLHPYPKSLTAVLHDDAIRTDYGFTERSNEPEEPRRVECDPFVGVAPGQFSTYFTALERKLEGKLLAVDRATAIPRLAQQEYGGVFGVEPAYLERETLLIDKSAEWLPVKKQGFDEMKARPEPEELHTELKRGIEASKTADPTELREEGDRVEEK